MKTFQNEKILKRIGIGILIALVLAVIFIFGVLVGRKGFSFWERRGESREFVPQMMRQHGVIGNIDSLGNNTLVVKDRSGALITVTLDSSVKIIQNARISIKFSDLKKGEEIIVLGEPDPEGSSIKARIIRVIESSEIENTPSATPSAPVQ